MLPNRPEFIEANAAAMRVGATVSFVNPRAPAADAQALFERTKADVVVTHRDDLGDAPRCSIGDDYENALARSIRIKSRRSIAERAEQGRHLHVGDDRTTEGRRPVARAERFASRR